MIEAMTSLGAEDPEELVRSDAQGYIPQLATFLFMRQLWPGLIDRWRDDLSYLPEPSDRVPPVFDTPFGEVPAAVQRMVNAGADPADIGAFAREVAYETVFSLLYRLSDFTYTDVEIPHRDELPGWRLLETDSEGDLTGRSMGGLYESLLAFDPSGREGRPVPAKDDD